MHFKNKLNNKPFINLSCSVCKREISDLSLFVQTSPYGLGLYKKTSVPYFSIQTSRSVNKKLLLNLVFGIKYERRSLIDLISLKEFWVHI
jgi:hypothetical protein